MNSANVIEIEEPETVETTSGCEVRMPAGLLGFEQIKNFLLIANPAEAPFRWLQVKDNPSLAFVVIEPFFFMPDYSPDIPQQDVNFLGLSSPDDAAVFNIVTVHNSKGATVNLKGPVVINRNTGVGKQVVIANAAQYSVQHPLPVNEAA
jgi:flagellar assembly factor FliW